MHRHLRTLLASDRAPGAGWLDGPDPHFAQVGLLLPMNGVDGGTTFTDASLNAHAVSRFGVTTSTAQERWGGSSALISSAANTNRLEVPHHASLSATTQDFTIEAWVYFTSVAGGQVIFSKAAGAGFYPYQIVLEGGELKFRGYSSGLVQVFSVVGKSAPQPGRWYFVQGVRRGGVCEFRVDGVVQAAVDIGANAVLYENVTNLVSVGGPQGGLAVSVVGHLNAVRFTKGVARPVGRPRGPWAVA